MVIIGSKRGILNVACLRLQLGQVPFVKDVLFQNNNEEEDDGEEQKKKQYKRQKNRSKHYRHNF